MQAPPQHHVGATLVELTITFSVLGVLMAIAVPRSAHVVERLTVRAASQDVLFLIAAARNAATRRGDYASFVADPRTGKVRVVSNGVTLLERAVADSRGVKLEATRESITFAPTGVGWGAANTTIVVSRGSRSDTIVTSRLGRVRHF